MSPGLAPVPFWSDAEVSAALTPVVEHLRAGRLIAYPTETVYGFGGTLDPVAVNALVRLKTRPPGKPFLILVAGSDMLTRLDLTLTPEAARLAARHWPGPLTIVLPSADRQAPPSLRGPEGGIAVRWTPHVALGRLIHALGQPITSTSANRPRVPPSTSATEIVEQWSDEIARGRLMVLDGGRLSPSEPSTVVDCTGRLPRVIRPGAIPASVLRESAPDLVGDT